MRAIAWQSSIESVQQAIEDCFVTHNDVRGKPTNKTVIASDSVAIFDRKVGNKPIEDCFVPRNDVRSKKIDNKTVIASDSVAIFDRKVGNKPIEDCFVPRNDARSKK